MRILEAPEQGGHGLDDGGRLLMTPMGVPLVGPLPLVEAVAGEVAERGRVLGGASLFSLWCTQTDFISFSGGQIAAGLEENLEREWVRLENLPASGGEALAAARKGLRKLRRRTLSIMTEDAGPSGGKSCSAPAAPTGSGLLAPLGGGGLTALLSGYKLLGCAGAPAALLLGRVDLEHAVEWVSSWQEHVHGAEVDPENERTLGLLLSYRDLARTTE